MLSWLELAPTKHWFQFGVSSKHFIVLLASSKQVLVMVNAAVVMCETWL